MAAETTLPVVPVISIFEPHSLHRVNLHKKNSCDNSLTTVICIHINLMFFRNGFLPLVQKIWYVLWVNTNSFANKRLKRSATWTCQHTTVWSIRSLVSTRPWRFENISTDKSHLCLLYLMPSSDMVDRTVILHLPFKMLIYCQTTDTKSNTCSLVQIISHSTLMA